MRGGQWQVLRLHEGLVSRGHDSLLMAREGSPLLSIAGELGLPCEPLRAWGIVRVSRKFDIVHAHDARSHTLGSVLARVPLVVSRRVAFPVKNTAASRWKYGRPAMFLAVSRFVARELSGAGVEEHRIEVVYDGVPVPARSASGEEILVPYSLDPGKCLALAEAAAARAGIRLRRSSNLTGDLPNARALVYLSKSEGLGSGILLGMAHGVTVIASETGGIPELIRDGVSGLLVPNEEREIAAAFERIDPRLGAAARETVLGGFTEEHMIQSTIAVYERVCSR
jgi:glycosyltransferase involved in cell wall biosynthesis